MKIIAPEGQLSGFEKLIDLIPLEVVSSFAGPCLRFVNNILVYGKDGDKKGDLVFFDLEKEWHSHSNKSYSLKKEPLAKSLGIKGDGSKTVFDATCGTGKDSILLLKFGARIIATERNPAVAALFYNAVLRAIDGNTFLSDLLQERFKFFYSDSKNIEVDGVDAIYLDPMYPHKKKAALPRKEMQIFRQVVGDDSDANLLFNWAISQNVSRVVVKRPIHAENLGHRPDHSFVGKSTRYDLYLSKN